MADPELGGIILDVAEASVIVQTRGDSQLNEARDALFRAFTRESSALISNLHRATNEILSEIDNAPFTVDGRKLTEEGRSLVSTRINQELRQAFISIEEEIEDKVGRAIRRAQRSQETYLERYGISRLSPAQRIEIQEITSRLMNEEFPPGSGLNFRDRLNRLETHHRRQLQQFVRRTYIDGDAIDKIAQDVRNGLVYRGPGNTPVTGGSAFRQVRRVLVAEETRLANQIEIETIQSSGVKYAYWRLSASHKWYGGKEICEYYASRILPSVQTKLGRLGVGDTELQGLHEVGRWPQYPHPFCRCYPEAWFSR